MFHLRRVPVLLALLPGLALQALSPAVTIRNRSGVELTVRRPSGGSESPILIHASSDGQPMIAHRLCSAFPHRSPDSEGPLEFRLKDGDTATFQFEDEGSDHQSELIFCHADSEKGLVFKGIVLFSVLHFPTAQEGVREAVGRLSLPKGPTPRTRQLPLNKDIQVLSDTEMELH